MDLATFLDGLYHEKQFGALCAVHCMNNLLQGQYFSEVDFASFAQELDEQERNLVLEEYGIHSKEYAEAVTGESGNVSEDGFFSVQVLLRAMQVWNLRMRLIDGDDPEQIRARNSPEDESAFICNHQNHWFTFRCFAGQHWINLNSTLRRPEYLSRTYVSLFIEQLRLSGFSVFVVKGELPASPADESAALLPNAISIPPSTPLTDQSPFIKSNSSNPFAAFNFPPEAYDPHLREAIQESLNETDDITEQALALSASQWEEDDANALEAAIQASLIENDHSSIQKPEVSPSSPPPAEASSWKTPDPYDETTGELFTEIRFKSDEFPVISNIKRKFYRNRTLEDLFDFVSSTLQTNDFDLVYLGKKLSRFMISFEEAEIADAASIMVLRRC